MLDKTFSPYKAIYESSENTWFHNLDQWVYSIAVTNVSAIKKNTVVIVKRNYSFYLKFDWAVFIYVFARALYNSYSLTYSGINVCRIRHC
jgi:hypothetical protein